MCAKLVAREFSAFSRDALLLLQYLQCCQGLESDLCDQLPYTGVKIRSCNMESGSAFLKEVQMLIDFHRSPADGESELLKVSG